MNTINTPVVNNVVALEDIRVIAVVYAEINELEMSRLIIAADWLQTLIAFVAGCANGAKPTARGNVYRSQQRNSVQFFFCTLNL